MKGSIDCKPVKLQVIETKETHVKISVPKSGNDIKELCVMFGNSKCYPENEALTLEYVSFPSCTAINPGVSWASGGRNITITGKNLEVADNVKTTQSSKADIWSNNSVAVFKSPRVGEVSSAMNSTVFLVIENHSVHCLILKYHSDPEFTGFSYSAAGSNLQLAVKRIS
ncbi:plexin-C1-like [Latimeria chalumnae]|uniref:plexin-C1-like n=1 Tax=Latimeria chalumnae TaxID=7897 RepID=UPI00313C678F